MKLFSNLSLDGVRPPFPQNLLLFTGIRSMQGIRMPVPDASEAASECLNQNAFVTGFCIASSHFVASAT